MGTDIGPDLRQLVSERAGNRCEYCRLPEAFALHRHEPDHIVARQHGGDSGSDNLAWACFRCNRHKGPNVGSFDPLTGQLTPLYHPRTQSWADHFDFQAGRIEPLTPEGRVTVNLLRLNQPERVSERRLLFEAGVSFG